jgi:hypothetical protein
MSMKLPSGKPGQTEILTRTRTKRDLDMVRIAALSLGVLNGRCSALATAADESLPPERR